MKIRKSNAAPVGVLTKVLSIFDLLDHSPDGLQLRAIAEQTKLNKSTAYRFLAHLENAGYLVRDSAGAYLLGPRLVHLGSGSTYQLTIRKMSRPILEALWRETGETVNLAVLDGKEILYLDVLESPHNFRLVSQIGMRRPIHCTALGKAILASQSTSFRDELLAGTKFERLTPHSIIRPAELLADLGRIQRRGYALDDEEVELGARCVAAPVLDSSGSVAAGVSVSGPTIRMSRSRTSQITDAVKKAALEISQHLGYSAS
jgi:DNA-binding IclR family transcriptional regulator